MSNTNKSLLNEDLSNYISNNNLDIIPPEQTFKYSGMFNQGNTCYLNSLLQCLFMTPCLRERIFKWNYKESIHGKSKDCIPFQIQKLFARLNNKYFKAESTEDLTKSFQWTNSEVLEQHDIQELCRVLFDALEQSFNISNEDNLKKCEDINNEVNSNLDYINNLYEGKTESVVKCLTCGYESVKYDKFLDLSVPIRNEFDKIYNTSLEMALLSMLKEEKLEKSNQYMCCKCNKKVDAKKFVRFNTLPEILFIQLCRFDYDFMSGNRKKINDRVTFPEYLDFKNLYELNNNISYYDLTNNAYNEENLKKLALMNTINSPIFENNKEINKDYIYKLFGIVIHAGSASAGHYYSLISSFEDNKWYRFEDHKVYNISDEELFNSFGGEDNSYNSSTAYCLMYEKVNSSLNKSIKDKYKDFSCFKKIINKSLYEYIENENKKVAEEIRKREDKFNTLNLKIYVDNSNSIIEIKKNDKVKDLKIKLLKKNIVKLPNYILSEISNKWNISLDNNNENKEHKDNFNKEFYEKAINYFRIRLYHLNKKLDVLDSDIFKRVEESGFYNHKSYTIEIKPENEDFEEYDPDKIIFNICFWNKDYDVLLNKLLSGCVGSDNIDKSCFSYSVFKVNKRISLKEFKHKLFDFINNYNSCNTNKNISTNNIQESNTFIFTKQEYGINNYKLRDLINNEKLLLEVKFKKLPFKNIEDNEIMMLNFTDQMKIYVEVFDSNLINNNSNNIDIDINNDFKNISKFNQFFEEKCLNVKVCFNCPWKYNKNKTNKPKVSSYDFNNELEIKKTKTLRELKKKISNYLAINCNEFIIRKNTHNGTELKNLNDTIDKFTTSKLKLFLEIGVPMKESEIKLSVCLCMEDYSIFNVIPYKINKLGDFSVDLLWSFKELKYYLKNELLNFLESIEDNNKLDSCISNNSNKSTSKIVRDTAFLYSDYIKDLDWNFVYIRDLNNEKPTTYFHEEDILKESEFKSGKQVLLFYNKDDKCIKFSSLIINNKLNHNKKNNSFNDLNNSDINNKEVNEYKTINCCKTNIILRRWEQSKWNLTKPIDIFIPKKGLNYLELGHNIICKIYKDIKVSISLNY